MKTLHLSGANVGQCEVFEGLFYHHSLSSYIYDRSFAVIETLNFVVLWCSGQNRGSGPGVLRRQQCAGRIRSSRSEDKEGNVSNSESTLQGVSDQTDGHTEEHQPQFPALHHPQPREEGETEEQEVTSDVEKNFFFFFLMFLFVFFSSLFFVSHSVRETVSSLSPGSTEM